MACIFKYIPLPNTVFFVCLTFAACNQQASDNDSTVQTADSTVISNDANITENGPVEKAVPTTSESTPELGSKIVNYAGTLAGIPYQEAGRDTTGFDCSGFVYYVFKHYKISVPHSSRHMAEIGREISKEEAQEGDLVFFRGTNPASTEVGHVGIVVSGTGDKIKFIHSSSARSSPCVRFDSLEKPNYQRRFLMVRRVL